MTINGRNRLPHNFKHGSSQEMKSVNILTQMVFFSTSHSFGQTLNIEFLEASLLPRYVLHINMPRDNRCELYSAIITMISPVQWHGPVELATWRRGSSWVFRTSETVAKQGDLDEQQCNSTAKTHFHFPRL